MLFHIISNDSMVPIVQMKTETRKLNKPISLFYTEIEILTHEFLCFTPCHKR